MNGSRLPNLVASLKGKIKMKIEAIVLDEPWLKIKEQVQSIEGNEHEVTDSDVLNHALSLFAWSLEKINEGRVIASVEEASMKYTEVQMPIFEKLIFQKNMRN